MSAATWSTFCAHPISRTQMPLNSGRYWNGASPFRRMPERRETGPSLGWPRIKPSAEASARPERERPPGLPDGPRPRPARSTRPRSQAASAQRVRSASTQLSLDRAAGSAAAQVGGISLRLGPRASRHRGHCRSLAAQAPGGGGPGGGVEVAEPGGDPDAADPKWKTPPLKGGVSNIPAFAGE
jgi:hypothetical protein